MSSEFQALDEACPAGRLPREIVERSPTSVSVRFDEPVDASLGGIRVTGPDGRRVDAGTVRRGDGGRLVTTSIGETLPDKLPMPLQVHKREGEPCPRCGRPIRKIVVGGRGTYVCEHCQPRPRASRPCLGSRRPTSSSARRRPAR